MSDFETVAIATCVPEFPKVGPVLQDIMHVTWGKKNRALCQESLSNNTKFYRSKTLYIVRKTITDAKIRPYGS